MNLLLVNHYRTNQDVVTQWKKDLENQKNIHFSYEIILENENMCVANWRVSFESDKKYDMDGIFYFKLDSANKCCYFKQWWVVK